MDPLAGQPVTTSSSVLILNGILDPQTPIENATALSALVNSPHKTFVNMPTSAHATISHAEAQNVADPPCGYQVLLSFLQTPETPDTSCKDAGLPVSFSSTEAAETWFGTADLWNDSAGGDAGDAASDAGQVPTGADDAGDGGALDAD
jgi:hypothetical protein